MQYMVVTNKNVNLNSAIKDMRTQINSWCNCGWKPQGGISIALEPHSDYQMGTYFYVAQAMIKED